MNKGSFKISKIWSASDYVMAIMNEEAIMLPDAPDSHSSSQENFNIVMQYESLNKTQRVEYSDLI